MNRVIKFRLIKENKIVGYQLSDEDIGWIYSRDGRYFGPIKIDHDFKQQFTELYDKNEKEIYEGDFIKESFNPHLNIWEIKSMPSYFTAEGRGYRFPLHSLKYQFEVIGNIFQNPELLKEVS